MFCCTLVSILFLLLVVLNNSRPVLVFSGKAEAVFMKL
jgi:hypothetical protein